MRTPKVDNKYNLTFSDIRKLEIGDRTKIKEPLFWRNNVIHAWCISETTIKTPEDSLYGTYNEYWIEIYDDESKVKRKLKVYCSSFGGMCSYKFSKFFDAKEIENELDLEIQEKLLLKINQLIDEGILVIPRKQ